MLQLQLLVITSYSIHYTKLYDCVLTVDSDGESVCATSRDEICVSANNYCSSDDAYSNCTDGRNNFV